MAVTVDVRHAQQTLRTMAQRLSKEQVARATARAINHTSSKAQTVAKRAILQRYNLHKTQVQGKRLKLNRATPRKQEGGVDAHKRPQALISFLGTHQTKKGVRVSVVNGQKKLLRGAFITTTKKGRRGVFARGQHVGNSGGQFEWRHKRISPTGPDNPIEELYTISAHSAGLAPTTQAKMETLVHASFTARLLHEMQQIANGITT